MREAASFIARQSGSVEAGALKQLAGFAHRSFRSWRNRHKIAALTDFDDHLLADLGLQREDVRQALDLPFAHDPALGPTRAVRLAREIEDAEMILEKIRLIVHNFDSLSRGSTTNRAWATANWRRTPRFCSKSRSVNWLHAMPTLCMSLSFGRPRIGNFNFSENGIVYSDLMKTRRSPRNCAMS